MTHLQEPERRTANRCRLLFAACQLISALFLMLVTIAPAGAQSVGISSSSAKGVDSVRFDWPMRVGYQAQTFGNALAIVFNRSFAADFSQVANGVGDYISAVSLDSDNRTVLIDLNGSPRFRSRRIGTSVVLDFFDRNAAPPTNVETPAPASNVPARSASAPTARPAADRARLVPPPPAPRSANAPELRVRTGTHNNFYRFVFDWAEQTSFKITEYPDRAVIRFDSPAWINDDKVRRVVPDRFKGFSSQLDDNALNVTVPLQAQAGVRHFINGTRIVFDVVAGGDPRRTGLATVIEPAAPSQPTLRGASNEVAVRLGLQPEADGASVPPAQVPPAAVSARPASAERTGNEAQVAVDSGGTKPPASGTGEEVRGPSLESVPIAFGAASRVEDIGFNTVMPTGGSLVSSLRDENQGGADGPVIPVTASRDNDLVSVRFEWKEPVAAAVFTRAGYAWIVFGAPARFDLKALNTVDYGVFGEKNQVPVSGGSAVRFPIVEGVNPSVWRNNTVWIVDFRPQDSRPDVPLRVETQRVSAQGPRVFIPLDSHGPTVTIRDPVIGDQLFVVPVASLSRGVEGLRRFTEFNLLNLTQGVVVQPLSDDIAIRSLPDGVAITKRGGLTISYDAPQSTDDQVARRIDGLPPGLPPGRVFDFSNWRMGGADKFLEDKQEIQRRISEATSIARSGPRLELAHFYFAHGLAADAMGLLRAIESEDEDLSRRPDVKALRGAAQLMLGRYTEAEADLMDRNLNGLSEAELWRGATKASQGRWPEAVEHFARAGEIPGGYPRNVATQVALLAAEGAIRVGDVRSAGTFIDVVADGQPTQAERARLDFLRGRILYAAGDTDTALNIWQRLSEGEERRSRVLSERALVEHRLIAGEISRMDAITALESLRYTWRGDQVEFDLLRELGRLYLEEEEYADGLNALREAVTFFPNNLFAEQVAEEMTDAFSRIFTKGGSDKMTSIEALSLYDQFRELTPVGARGDEIIQRLADRLVQVDLLDRASILLERQVKFRLQGDNKARVGARLALIRLLDRRPEEALAALDDSVAPRVSADVALERKRLRARAAFELGDADDALRLLAGDQSRDADLLRADIFWRTQRWAQAAGVFQRLVGRSGQDGRRIDERAATLILNWAVSLSLSNNVEQVSRVRQIFTQQMDNTPFREAFRLITNKSEGELDDFRTLADRFGEIGRFQSFLASYRDRLKDKPLSATN